MYFFFAYKKNINSFVAFNHISKNLHKKTIQLKLKKYIHIISWKKKLIAIMKRTKLH